MIVKSAYDLFTDKIKSSQELESFSLTPVDQNEILQTKTRYSSGWQFPLHSTFSFSQSISHREKKNQIV